MPPVHPQFLAKFRKTSLKVRNFWFYSWFFTRFSENERLLKKRRPIWGWSDAKELLLNFWPKSQAEGYWLPPHTPLILPHVQLTLDLKCLEIV